MELLTHPLQPTSFVSISLFSTDLNHFSTQTGRFRKTTLVTVMTLPITPFHLDPTPLGLFVGNSETYVVCEHKVTTKEYRVREFGVLRPK